MKIGHGFLIENQYTATDIYHIEDLFEQIEMIEDKIKHLFAEGHSAYDEIRQELVCLVNCYELLREKTQGHNQCIENKFSSRLEETRPRMNQLLERAEKLGITVKRTYYKEAVYC